jgi:hypothetical protein
MKTKEEDLSKLRKEATDLMKKTKGSAVSMRSCWKCNPAHEHFKKGEWGDWILYCFACGHYFYKRKDITIVKVKK